MWMRTNMDEFNTGSYCWPHLKVTKDNVVYKQYVKVYILLIIVLLVYLA